MTTPCTHPDMQKMHQNYPSLQRMEIPVQFVSIVVPEYVCKNTCANRGNLVIELIKHCLERHTIHPLCSKIVELLIRYPTLEPCIQRQSYAKVYRSECLQDKIDQASPN